MVRVFTTAERRRIRDELIAFAHADAAIAGAALVGSAAREAEDAWSDIDLVLQLGDDADEPVVVERWTTWMTREFDVADHFDVTATGGIRYRVFLLASSLQIDVSFWPLREFRATEAAFRLLFGEANAPSEPASPRPSDTIGLGWLYAIHARSAIARGRVWQAQLMLDELRSAVLTLRCLGAGLNPWHGREVDLLPPDVLERLDRARARDIEPGELRRSLAAHVREFLAAAAEHDPERARLLDDPLRIIAAP